MAALTDYLEAALLEFLFRDGALTRPDPVYVALHTADPTETGAVAEVDGTDWTNYARVAVETGADTGFDANEDDGAGGKQVKNTAIVDFGTAAVTGTQADVTHVSVWDALTNGNCLMKGALGSAKPITNGDPVKFNAGQLKLQMR